jgi:glycosyltransferase involved in cell wall biosynthesis
MQRTSVLFIGHDLKFLGHVIRHYEAKADYRIEVRTYSGHVLPDTDKIQKELARFDLIFCEWGLGNLKWFSQFKYPGQKLIVRIHSQEFSTPYLKETRWKNVDRIIFVGPNMMEKFLELYPGQASKCQVINNLVDTSILDLPKKEGSRYNLGMLGILPKLKSPQLAFEILRELRRTDPRYRLFIKGKMPEELDWLMKRNDEKAYYEEFLNGIKESGLEDAVIFEPFGVDVAEWFTNIGFILSTSENEAFHLAVAEGMASGAVPVIRNWEGSEALFPNKLIFKDINEAVDLVLKNTEEKNHQALGNELKEFCRKNFSLEAILPQYDEFMTTRIEDEKMNEEYYKLLVQRKQLATELLSTEEELEKAHEIEGVYHNLELEYESLEAKLLDYETRYRSLYVKYNEINIKYQELYAKSQVLANQKVVYIQQVESLKIKSEKLIEVRAKLLLQVENTKKWQNKYNELNELYKETNANLKLAKRKLNDSNKKIEAIQNSLSWKVGSALIATPAGIIRKVIK